MIFSTEKANFSESVDSYIKLFKYKQLDGFKDVETEPTLKMCIAADAIIDDKLLRFGADHYKQVSEFKEHLYECERLMQDRLVVRLEREIKMTAEIADHTRQMAEYNKNKTIINQQDSPKKNNDFSL